MIYRLKDVAQLTKGVAGLMDTVLREGQLSGDHMFITLPDGFDWQSLPLPHSLPGSVLPVPAAEPDEPTAVEMASNFGGAMARWIAAGFPVVTEEQNRVRKSICDRCEFWDDSARFGLGKCKAPGCGCTAFKRWLTTETCKHPQGSQWPPLK